MAEPKMMPTAMVGDCGLSEPAMEEKSSGAEDLETKEKTKRRTEMKSIQKGENHK